MYYRRLTIKISLSAPLSLARMSESLLTLLMWGAGTGGAALTAADQLVTREETQPHLGVGPQGAHSSCLLPCVVLSMIKSEGNNYSHVDMQQDHRQCKNVFWNADKKGQESVLHCFLTCTTISLK